MSFISRNLVAALSLVSFAQALSIPPSSRSSASDLSKRTPDCENGPGNRGQWLEGFDISTNYYDSWPNTGRTVEYNLVITNTTCNPDGHGEKWCQLINGGLPGPVIRANWGDTVRVNVHNALEQNGTSIHWHGIRQINSCQMDGTNGITECPIPPNGNKTYEWVATQYGSSWYHSHHTAQYGEGVYGSIIIDGPATADYDEDLGILPLSDWHYQSVFSLLSEAMYQKGPPPSAQNVLVNGTMVDGQGHGQYAKVKIEAGKKYRLRFVNTAVDHLFHVSMDNHPFTVISADFVAVHPYSTTDLKINIGQRYDVVFTADQVAANYWLRVNAAGPTASCGFADIYQNNVTRPVVGAILNYEGAADALPISSPYPNDGTCSDESIYPYLPTPVSTDFHHGLDFLNVTTGFGDHGIVEWYINGTTLNVDWEEPTLSYVVNNKSFPPNMNIVQMPKPQSWYLWVIENTPALPIPHPIHLHGHDFEVLGSGLGPFPRDGSSMNLAAPVRRDVATLPGGPQGGWLLLAVYTDNPGAWLMHCHIAWHASQGLSMQFVERQDEILDHIGDVSKIGGECAAWSDFWDGPVRMGSQVDSGL